MEQTDLFRYAVRVLDELGAPYIVVGSFASALYGEPRMTLDIDIVVQLSPEHVEPVCRAFSSEEYYISREAVVEAVANGTQFNVIHAESGNKIDFMIARTDEWGRDQMARRRRAQFLPGLSAWVASPEDVIIGKMVYYRDGRSDKHLRDGAGILKLSGDEIDRDYIERWARRLELDEAWQAILNRIG